MHYIDISYKNFICKNAKPKFILEIFISISVRILEFYLLEKYCKENNIISWYQKDIKDKVLNFKDHFFSL